MQTTIKVNGMVCNGCENRVQNALKSIEGIEEVKADHNKGEVTITAKEEINIKDVEAKIEDIGFEIVKEG